MFFKQDNSLAAEIIVAGHNGIHNFSFGTLAAYFSLTTAQSSFENGVLIIDGARGGSRRKVFVFRADAPIDQLRELQRSSVIYSQQKLALPKESKFKELGYDLEKVFDPQSYANARKRAKRLRYPFARLQRDEIVIRDLELADRSAAAELHTRWCAWKLANPATFQMMFPKRRYLECVDVALESPQTYAAYGAFRGDKLLGVRVLYIEGSSAFDLAFFTDPDAELSGDFAEHFNIATMWELRQNEIDWLYCGASLNKHLSAFKSHWPHFEVISFSYGKLA